MKPLPKKLCTKRRSPLINRYTRREEPKAKGQYKRAAEKRQALRLEDLHDALS